MVILWFGTVAGAMEYFPAKDHKSENQPLTNIKSLRLIMHSEQ